MAYTYTTYRFDEEEFDDDSNSDLSDMSEVDDGDEDVDDEMGAMIHQFDTDMEEDEVSESYSLCNND